MKLMTVMIAALTLLGTTWAQGQHTQKGRRSASMQTTSDITMVSIRVIVFSVRIVGRAHARCCPKKCKGASAHS
jgi:hypothetical protein